MQIEFAHTRLHIQSGTDTRKIKNEKRKETRKKKEKEKVHKRKRKKKEKRKEKSKKNLKKIFKNSAFGVRLYKTTFDTF